MKEYSFRTFFVEKVFLLDIEGVLADSHTAYLNEINKLYGQHFTLESITKWNLVTCEKSLKK